MRFTGHPEWPDTGPAEIGESGLVIVVVARERGSSVRVCEFLVDTWCLGVKNALGPKPVLPGISCRMRIWPHSRLSTASPSSPQTRISPSSPASHGSIPSQPRPHDDFAETSMLNRG